jgi:hypothetical protein
MPVNARAFALARLLLNQLGIITSALTLASMSACVLPLAPEFQDPPTSQNTPPIIQVSDPLLGSIVTGPNATPIFRVTVTDQNSADTLVVRWIADYPPYDPALTRQIQDQQIPPSPNGTPQDSTITLSCFDSLSTTLAEHQVFVVVADRPFVQQTTNPPDFTQVEPGGFAVTGSWIWVHQCQ